MEKEMVGMTEVIKHPNEEIIELTDEITTTLQNDDEIIELVTEVAPADSTDPADSAAAYKVNPESEETNAFETAPAVLPDGGIKIGDDIDDELDFDEGIQDDFVNSMGVDLETDSAISQLPEAHEPLLELAPAETAPSTTDVISSDQIEAAIERVIMKILPEKIDSILTAAIEKTLTREIEKIKTLLLEDSGDDGV